MIPPGAGAKRVWPRNEKSIPSSSRGRVVGPSFPFPGMKRNGKPPAPKKSSGKYDPKTGRTLAKAPRNAAGAMTYTKWWEREEEDVARAVEDRIRQLWEDDAARRFDIEKNLKRWGLDLAGLYRSEDIRTREVMRVNLTKSLTETITAKIGKNRPRPLVLTDGGSFGLRQKAKRLQRFLDGVYQQANVYEKSPLLFRNAMLCGTGVGFVTGNPFARRFELENVFPLECLVDNIEASRGEEHTRNFFRLYPDDKDRLVDLYPRHRRAIETASMTGPDMALPTADALNPQERQFRTVMVYEAWRKAGWNANGEIIPGRHVLAVNGEALVDEDWVEFSFPFIFQHWNAPVRGFWGDSAISETRPLEKEVNTLLQRAQDAMRRVGMPFVLEHVDANISEQQMTNEPGVRYKWEGQIKPELTLGQPVHPQILEQAWQLRRVAAEQLGTNELQVSATKPAGIESGRALEQLSEEHAVRFDTVSRQFEQNISKHLAAQFVRVGRQMDAFLRDMGVEEGLRLRAVHDNDVLDIRWEEAALQPEELFLDTWPVSVLPHTPAARTAEIERWQKNRWCTDDEAKVLLEFPDLKSTASVSRANQDLVEWQLAEMLDEGRAVEPDERQNLEQARIFGTHAKLKARREGVPASRLELLEDYLQILDEWLQPPPADPLAQGGGLQPLPPAPQALGGGAVGPTDPAAFAPPGPGMPPMGGAPPMMM